MGLLDLFMVASVPVMKVLLICGLGSFLALDHIDILGESARKQINNVVFFVFNPALVSSNLAQTITLENIVSLWFMPVNILLTFILGLVFGWVLGKITKAPQHLKGLVIGSCAAGNLGNLPLILVPAICREKGSPFGAPDSCLMYGMAYVSLSMAIGAIYLWSIVYNIVRVSSTKSYEVINVKNKSSDEETSKSLQEQLIDELDLEGTSAMDDANVSLLSCAKTDEQGKVFILDKIKKQIYSFFRNINLKAILAPSTTAAIVGFIVGLVPPIQRLMIGASAPLHVVQDSALLLGEAAIPIVTLIVGANLLRGLRGSGVQLTVILGIIAIRYVFLPLIGVLVIRGAIHLGFVHADPLYQFVLLLQYALPPAMNIGTITQLFGSGQSECSVILLWTYSVASVSLTLWSTYFMWLVAKS
ncbi:protein PIN-LIKES 3-like isoform X1 [Coffea eugenioides]|uniref:protein PIN-LIKES 3-like isoform X1 n=1 Tax=Coffea eugenioides TaxID=49369 RepID=UPI000F611943|nr:protein PIN-LIKES 3-like isoform X1 [Coffea eugenioides]